MKQTKYQKKDKGVITPSFRLSKIEERERQIEQCQYLKRKFIRGEEVFVHTDSGWGPAIIHFFEGADVWVETGLTELFLVRVDMII